MNRSQGIPQRRVDVDEHVAEISTLGVPIPFFCRCWAKSTTSSKKSNGSNKLRLLNILGIWV
jgi:hypothetical protein